MNETTLATPTYTAAPVPNELRALLALTKYPLIAMLRNVSTVAFGFMFPIVFIAVFGLIGSGGGGGLRVGMIPTEAQGPVFTSLQQLPGLTMTQADESTLERQLRLGKLDSIVRLQGNRVVLEINSASPQSQISQLWIQGLLNRLNLQAAGITPTYALEVGEIAGRRDRYIDFALPGQIGFALLSTAIFGTVFGLLYLKKALILKRLFATPVHGITILLGQGLARLFVATLQTLVILAVGVFAFGFQLANGWVTFLGMLLLSALGLLVFMGFGLLIAGRTNDENAASPLTNLFTLPQFLLSGVFFSTDVFPSWVRIVADNLPLSYLNTAMRLVANEGAGPLEVFPYVLGMIAWGAAAYIIAARTFKWV
jgi:ABC-2 type transport system permease protein